MSSLFHFPTEYGKLGNWPGMVNSNQAQAILMDALSKQPNARFVELGFNGGRTTVVMSWAMREFRDVKLDVVGIGSNEGALWIRRARLLFSMDDSRIGIHQTLAPFPADLIVVNQGMAFPDDWAKVAPVGASIICLGANVPANEAGNANHFSNLKVKVNAPGQFTIWEKTGNDRIVESAIQKVVSDMSQSNVDSSDESNCRTSAIAPVAVVANSVAKIHSLRRNKKRDSDGSGSDTAMDDGMDPRESA